MGICAPTMLAHASDRFNRRHIPAILAADEIWVQFFSEPGCGSDLAGVTTRATRDGDHWVLSGSKIWSSGAYYADYGMCLARTNWDVPKHRGLTWFAVATTAPGVIVRPIREINGDAEFCEEFFDDVLLSDDDVIGEVDHGWPVARTMLVFERGARRPATPAEAARPGGLAPDLVALARAAGREKDPVVRQLIARAHANDFVEAELKRRVEARLRHGEPMASSVAAYAKLASGTFGPVRARIGLEIGRGAAVAWPSGDVDRMAAAVNYLNSRVLSIAGGSNEMQRNGISEGVLGLPREAAVDVDKPFGEVLRSARRASGRS
jgi:alkylation response protein AidB-like acyl-CoA dehydrogenase